VVEAKDAGSQFQAKGNSVRPAGRWTTECDPLKVLRITWTSQVRLTGGTFLLEAEFNNFAERFSKRGLPGKSDPVIGAVSAFKIMLKPDTIWLDIMSDGTLAPEHTGFDQSVVAYSYPGGYDAIADELMTLGIDWSALYVELKAAAEMIEESVDINKFCPTPSRKQQWPRTLTG